MKKLFLILFILSQGAMAAHPDQISVTVDGTTYQCSGSSGGGGDCSGVAESFRSALKKCIATRGKPWVNECISDMKKMASDCSSSVAYACYEVCVDVRGSTWISECSSQCSK